MKTYLVVVTMVTLTGALGGCRATASGVVKDTQSNTAAVKGAIETLDVKAAIVNDATIDAGAIDVDTNGEKKLVVIRGSVPTQAQKDRAGQIAAEHAKGYTIDNQLAVVPTTTKPTDKPATAPAKPTPPAAPATPAPAKPTPPAAK